MDKSVELDDLINENIKLVSFVLGKYFQGEYMMEKEDMFQCGCIGLYHFCEDWINGKYVDKSYQFSTLAIFHIRGQISHALDHQYRKNRMDYDVIKRNYEYDNREKIKNYNIRFYFEQLIENNILDQLETKFVIYKLNGYTTKDIQLLMNVNNYKIKKILNSIKKKVNKNDIYDLLSN